MPSTRAPYPQEFRRQIIDLVRAGRTPRELAQEFKPTYEMIHAWVHQADQDEGRTASGLSSKQRDELRGLHREIRQLHLQREMLAKAAKPYASGDRLGTTKV